MLSVSKNLRGKSHRVTKPREESKIQELENRGKVCCLAIEQSNTSKEVILEQMLLTKHVFLRNRNSGRAG